MVLSCADGGRAADDLHCDARHAKAALDMAANKTDANDADGLAHLSEVGFFREVRVKGFDSMLARTLVAARNKLVKITTERASDQMHTFHARYAYHCAELKWQSLSSKRRARQILP